MIVTEQIDMQGFVYNGSCNCDGSYTEKWQRGAYQLRIKQTRFKIKKDGVTIKGWMPIDQLKTELQNVAL